MGGTTVGLGWLDGRRAALGSDGTRTFAAVTGSIEAADDAAAPHEEVSVRTSKGIRSRWGRASVRQRLVAVGLIGVLSITAGVGTYLAMIHPPYQQDEASHVGYVLSLRDGVLPSLGTEIPTERGGRAHEIAKTRSWPFGLPYIHIARNPPFPYAAAVVPAEITSALGVRAGPLLGVRMMNVAGMVVAVGMTFMLGRELCGSGRAGLASAGLVAGALGLVQNSSYAYIEGPALAATTGAAWALARFARTRALSAATWLGVWCALAAAVRPMALAFAGAAGAMALVLSWQEHRWRELWPLCLRLGGPTLILTGWFYALNVYRYGDPTGARGVYELHGTSSDRSFIDVLLSTDSFVAPFDYLLAEVYGRRGWWEDLGARPMILTVLALVVVALAIVLAAGRKGQTTSQVRTSWIVVMVLGLVPPVLISQHMSAGGAGHARYLTPVIPLVMVALVAVLGRAQRWLPVVAVVVYVGFQATRVRQAGHLHLDSHWRSPEVRGALVGQPFRTIMLLWAAAGFVALVTALVALTAGERERSI